MTPRRLLALALFGLLAGCAGEEPPPTAPIPTTKVTATATPTATAAPRTITPQDDGATFAMALDSSSQLVIRDPNAPDPVASGDAVLLIPVVNVTDSGVREWELRAVARGTTTIRGSSPDFVVILIVR